MADSWALQLTVWSPWLAARVLHSSLLFSLQFISPWLETIRTPTNSWPSPIWQIHNHKHVCTAPSEASEMLIGGLITKWESPQNGPSPHFTHCWRESRHRSLGCKDKNNYSGPFGERIVQPCLWGQNEVGSGPALWYVLCLRILWHNPLGLPFDLHAILFFLMSPWMTHGFESLFLCLASRCWNTPRGVFDVVQFS